MTLLQSIIRDHLRQLAAARRQRRLAEYEAITAALALPDDDDADGAYEYLSEQDQPKWRANE